MYAELLISRCQEGNIVPAALLFPLSLSTMAHVGRGLEFSIKGHTEPTRFLWEELQQTQNSGWTTKYRVDWSCRISNTSPEEERTLQLWATSDGMGDEKAYNLHFQKHRRAGFKGRKTTCDNWREFCVLNWKNTHMKYAFVFCNQWNEVCRMWRALMSILKWRIEMIPVWMSTGNTNPANAILHLIA